MQRVAETLSERGLSEAKMSSIERRWARFIANERIIVSVIWKLFLEQALAPFQGQKLYFVLDNTPFRDDLTMVYLGLLVHSRVLPVAWVVMPAQTKWDEGQWDIVGRLLAQVSVHLPDTSCTLIADRGLAGMPLVRLCTSHGWHYLLRIRAEHARARAITMENSSGHGNTLTRSCSSQGIAGTVQPKSGKRKHWKHTSVSCGTQVVRSRGCLLAMRVQDVDTSRNMPGAGVWKRPFKTVKAVTSTSKPVGLSTERTRDRFLLALFLAMWWTSHLAAACIHYGQRQRG